MAIRSDRVAFIIWLAELRRFSLEDAGYGHLKMTLTRKNVISNYPTLTCLIGGHLKNK